MTAATVVEVLVGVSFACAVFGWIPLLVLPFPGRHVPWCIGAFVSGGIIVPVGVLVLGWIG